MSNPKRDEQLARSKYMRKLHAAFHGKLPRRLSTRHRFPGFRFNDK